MHWAINRSVPWFWSPKSDFPGFITCLCHLSPHVSVTSHPTSSVLFLHSHTLNLAHACRFDKVPCWLFSVASMPPVLLYLRKVPLCTTPFSGLPPSTPRSLVLQMLSKVTYWEVSPGPQWTVVEQQLFWVTLASWQNVQDDANPSPAPLLPSLDLRVAIPFPCYWSPNVLTTYICLCFIIASLLQTD